MLTRDGGWRDFSGFASVSHLSKLDKRVIMATLPPVEEDVVRERGAEIYKDFRFFRQRANLKAS